MYRLKKILPLAFLIFIMLSAVRHGLVSASIFDGGSSGSGGIFGGGNGFGGIFDGIRDILPGGAVISGPTPTPIPPGPVVPPPPPPPQGPSSPYSGKQLKLTLEWDALSMGGEGPDAPVTDPLATEHMARLKCPCRSGIYDSPNPQPTQWRQDPLATPPLVEPPKIWEMCYRQEMCRKQRVEHVLYGWCGDDPTILNPTRLGGDQYEYVTAMKEGPNTYTLPNAVSNKFIRRDGYMFACFSECEGFTCEVDNYVEFQTMIYPSNSVSLYLKAENLSDQVVDNVLLRASTLNYSEEGEYPVPHNLDYPYRLGSPNTPNPATPPAPIPVQDYITYPVAVGVRLPSTYPYDSAYTPLTTLPNGQQFASFAVQALNDLINAAAGAGWTAVVSSGFRSITDQTTVFERNVAAELAAAANAGTPITRAEAETRASRYSAPPGKSEHHLGTAVDLIDANHNGNDRYDYARQNWNNGFYRWLRENAHTYGFVISYPYGGSNIQDSKTGSGYLSNEPWHVRYLGLPTDPVTPPHVNHAAVLFGQGYLSPTSGPTVQSYLLALPQSVPVPPAPNQPVTLQAYNYSHGSTLGLNGISSPGVDWQVRLDPDPDPDIGHELFFGPFTLGPRGTSTASVELPFQPPASERSSIPFTFTTSPSNPSGSYPPAQIAPCECNSVRTHSVGGATCGSTVANPSLLQCFTYYQAFDAAGRTCDQKCIQVPGCPPPWCFTGSSCGGGPAELCPNRYSCTVQYVDPGAGTGQCNITQAKDSVLKTLVRAILPVDNIRSAVQSISSTVNALGCGHICENPPAQVSGVGGIVPRDYNFVCDPNDPTEAARCAGTDPDVIVPVGHQYFGQLRDVSGLGGCGYNASSNNSIIGPIQVRAEFGGEGDNRTGKSTLLASIPIGGRLSDDQSRAYGWPITGEIDQDWGYTGEAASQGPYKSIPSMNYGEYRYCTPQAPVTSTINPDPIVDPNAPINCDADSNINANLASYNIKGVTGTGGVGVGGGQSIVNNLSGVYVLGVTNRPNLIKCYDDVIDAAVIAGVDPAIAMTIWLEESGASNYDMFPRVFDFGCVGYPRHDFTAQLACFMSLQNAYVNSASYSTCRGARYLDAQNPSSRVPAPGLSVQKFLQLFSWGNSGCVNNNFGQNVNFSRQVELVYNAIADGNLERGCVLPSTRWNNGCASLVSPF